MWNIRGNDSDPCVRPESRSSEEIEIDLFTGNENDFVEAHILRFQGQFIVCNVYQTLDFIKIEFVD